MEICLHDYYSSLITLVASKILKYPMRSLVRGNGILLLNKEAFSRQYIHHAAKVMAKNQLTNGIFAMKVPKYLMSPYPVRIATTGGTSSFVSYLCLRTITLNNFIQS